MIPWVLHRNGGTRWGRTFSRFNGGGPGPVVLMILREMMRGGGTRDY